MNYKKTNNIAGIIIFIIACIVYISTVEPSTSLWDCGEYIATSNKLEVGHPPGAPTFMMLGRLVSAFSAPDGAAYMVNVLSAISSALTILFLFWTIVHLAKKIVLSDEDELSQGSLIAILGSGTVGALAYMFSDTFWFSAEEGEVYAMSSFFTAITFWAILKWEENSEKISSDRWIILIFFLVGLSIGVHMLNLLVIPAAGFVYYFRKYEFSIKGFLITGVVSIAILGFINSIFIKRSLSVIDLFERQMNAMGFGFNTGTFVFFVFLILVLGIAVYLSHIRGKRLFHTMTMSLVVLFIGYSTFSMIVVRSNANPPLDENNPETTTSLAAYLGREQYGDWPILKGGYWNSPSEVMMVEGNKPITNGKKYFKGYVVNFKGKDFSFKSEFDAQEFINTKKNPSLEVKEEYIVSGYKIKLGLPANATDNQFTNFPRMYWDRTDGGKIDGYLYWSDYKGNKAIRAQAPKLKVSDGNYRDSYIPTSTENFRYFRDYQMGWMYYRYFLWNFVGRQNDIQGHNQYYNSDGMIYKGSLTRGNWLSGINFIDKERVGTQNDLPSTMSTFETYNTYYYLPLLLGLLGLIFLILKAPKDAFSTFLLFFFTGMAIIIYLNQKPYEPRERDYAFAASFYAFAIWIGMGVLAIYKWAMLTDMKKLRTGIIATLGAGVLFFIIEFLNESSHAFSYSVLFMSVVGILMVVIPMFLFRSSQNKKLLSFMAVGIGMVIPVIMGFQNWDDHDRSDRYFAREIAKNYLNSCDKNAVLLCFGDNDTFPLWYAQEVEGIRTDMKVMNYSLLSADWHYNQLKRATYEAPEVETTLEEPDYRAGTRDVVEIKGNKTISARGLMEYMKQGKDRSPVYDMMGRSQVPYRKLYIDVDKDACIDNGLVREDQRHLIVDRVEWSLGGGGFGKADLAIIDMLSAYKWDRPLCFTSTSIQGANRGLSRYLQTEGMTAKFVPIIKPGHHREKMFSLLMGEEEKDLNRDGIAGDGFSWGNIEKEEVFCDYYTMRMIRSARMHYMQLAESYVNAASVLETNRADTSENKALKVAEYRNKAVQLLDKQNESFPIKSCKIDELLNFSVVMYYRAGDTAKGFERCNELAAYYSENITYFANQSDDYIKEMYQEIGNFVNHFERLSQGSRDTTFNLVKYNPDGYYKLTSKIGSLAASDVDFNQIIMNDVRRIMSRKQGFFPGQFYQEAVPNIISRILEERKR